LTEAYYLTGVFEAKGGSAPRADENHISGTEADLGPGRDGLNQSSRRCADRDFALCGDDSAGRDLAPDLSGGAERLKTDADQQHE
jgi:hypothetical protein